jgi:hypothetical protein
MHVNFMSILVLENEVPRPSVLLSLVLVAPLPYELSHLRQVSLLNGDI